MISYFLSKKLLKFKVELTNYSRFDQIGYGKYKGIGWDPKGMVELATETKYPAELDCIRFLRFD